MSETRQPTSSADGWRHHRWIDAILVFFALGLIASFATKMIARPVNDFEAYYHASERLLQGVNPYVSSDARHPFKYPPFTLLLFWPLALFPYLVSKWIFGILTLLMAAATPVLSWRMLRQFGDVTARDFKLGCILAIIASLRFLDAEFQENQIGSWMCFGLIAGCALITSAKSTTGIFFGTLVATLSASLKLYGAIAMASFFKVRERRWWLWPVAAGLTLTLVPWPPAWLWWAEQIRLTESLAPSQGGGIFQGWFSLWRTVFPVVDKGVPFLVFIPFGLVFFAWLPALGDPKQDGFRFTLTTLLLFLLSVTLSPLPWQHTYSVLWGIIPWIWVCASPRGKKGIVGVTLFLGLTPRGILGRDTAEWLERCEPVYLATLLLIGIGITSLRRLPRRNGD